MYLDTYATSGYKKSQSWEAAKIINLALRFIDSVYSRHSSVLNLHNRANLQKLKQCRVVSSLNFLYYRNLKLSREYYLQGPFRRSARRHHSKTIRQPISWITIRKFSLFPRAISYWNKLTERTVNSVSLEEFSPRIVNMCSGWIVVF